MHIVFVGPALAGMGAVAGGLFGHAGLAELMASGHRLHVLLDHDGPTASSLREAGARVNISAKRRMQRPDGSWASADELQAGIIRHVHTEDPVDLIVYSADFPVDLSWHEPTLGTIPTAVLLDGSAARQVRAVTAHGGLAMAQGRRLWAQASRWASSDLLLTAYDPSAFGLRTDGLPPWRVVAPEWTPYGGEPARLQVVMATGVDPAGAANLVRRLQRSGSITDDCTLVVVYADIALGRASMRELILEGCPMATSRQVVLVPSDEVDVIAGLVATADLLWAASPADLGGLGGLDTKAPIHPLFSAITPGPPFDWTVPECMPSTTSITVRVEGAPTDAAETLRVLIEDDDGPEVAILHAPAFTEEALRLAGYGRLGRGDITVLSDVDQVFGGPAPFALNRWVVAIHRRVWPSVLRRMDTAPDLDHVVRAITELGLMSSARIVVLPVGGRGALPFDELVLADPPPWTDDYGVLPRPVLVGAGGGGTARRNMNGVLSLEVVKRLRRSPLAAKVRRRFPDQMRRIRLYLENR